MTTEIAGAAARLSEARSVATAATVAAEAVAAECDEVQKHIDALRAERDEIAAERRAGKHDHEHAGKLALIDMDIADLAPLVAEVSGRLTTANAAAVEAEQEALRAEQALAVERAKVVRGELVALEPA